MNTYLISYDLGVPETSEDYKRVIKYLESFDSVKPLYSLWFIRTWESVSTIRDELKKLTDSNDGILVVNVSGDAWTTVRIDEETTRWMKSNI